MPELWTGELIGKMHNEGVTSNDLAKHLGITPGYVSMLLRSKRGKRGQRERLEKAFEEIVEERSRGNDYQNRIE